MKEFLFLTTVVCELLLGGSLVLTIAVPSKRVWPPPSKRSWQYYYTWGLTIAATAGTLALGVLDWDSFVLDHWLRFPVGGGLILFGTAFALWGVWSLGVHQTLGLEGRLVTNGAYRYSRNPQYVGDILILVGYALVTNSTLTTITALLGMAWFFLAPFTEEPWLRERFGAEYEEYVQRVPRFISLRGRRG